MNTGLLLVLYCIPIALASLFGGHLPRLVRMTHLRTQLLMSLVAGLMLGIACLHLLPHAAIMLPSASHTGAATLMGLVAMFLLIRLFHTHDHDTAHSGPFHNAETCQHHEHGADHSHDYDHHHDHEHDHAHEPVADAPRSVGADGAWGAIDGPLSPATIAVAPVKRIGWAGMFFGMMLHTMIDGVALASSVLADVQHHHSAMTVFAGLGTFFAVLLHKPLDAFAITSTMKAQRWPAESLSKINGVFALACPVGVFAFYYGARWIGQDGEIVGWALAVSAGFFICIALADILPEVAFHDHDRGKLTAALLLGIGLAVLIENLPGHDHTQGEETQPPAWNETTSDDPQEDS